MMGETLKLPEAVCEVAPQGLIDVGAAFPGLVLPEGAEPIALEQTLAAQDDL